MHVVKAGGMWKLSTLSAQFCCEHKMDSKAVYFKYQEEGRAAQTIIWFCWSIYPIWCEREIVVPQGMGEYTTIPTLEIK